MRIVTEFPHAVEVVENLFIPMPDGVPLAAKLWRPVGVKVPALLEYLPYRKRDGTRARDNGLHFYFAGHGYACLRVDIRGTGDSEGVITGEYTLQELADGEAVLAWIAEQDFCDGQVAMIGISWGGFNGLQLAARQPPALKTIITVGSTDDRYATDVHWVGGCLSKDNFDWSATMLASNDLPPDPAVVGDRWRAMWDERMRANRPWALDWMAHQRRDAHWQQGSICEDSSAIHIPVYAVSCWADNYSEAVPRLLAGLSGPRLGLIGPWAHSYPHDANVAPAIGWLQEVRRWLDHWLMGQAAGIMDEPMLRAWMQDPVPPQTCYSERPGRWVGEAEWPSPRIVDLTLALNPGGALGGTARNGTASINSPLWVGLGAGEIGRYGGDAEWPGDQREDDAGSLVFSGPVLTETLEILGAPKVRLRFRSDRPLALVSARLNDIAPDGSITRVTPGLLNLTHRHSHEQAEKLTPGEWHEATVELDDIAHSFRPGHRIAVSLSTTYWPIAWPSPEPVTLEVALGTSTLTLPHRPEDPADAHLRPFDPPEAAEQCPVIWHPVTPPHKRTVTRDLLTGRMTVDFPRWCYECEMPDIATTQSSTGFVRYHITEGDPLSAEMEAEYTTENRRPDGVFGHWHRGRMWCDATHFHLETDLKVSEDGVVIFENSWRESIPRDHV
jgi:putative CocE/NonD family hydrolase